MNPLPQLRHALSDRYSIVEEVGHGGMAIVYRAEDLKHNRQVAIKVLKPDLASILGPARFLREIQIEASLQHPNILPLFDSGEAEGLLYYVMPLVTGESLRERLERERHLSLDDTLEIARQIGDALDYAHSQGIVHRDIKPENILLSNGHVVVADFGIARAVSTAGGDRVTETGRTPGTPAYMSPEQAAGDAELDRRSDIYSFGCVLYEMMAGEPPFTGRTAQAVIARHIAERPPSLTVVRPSVSPSVSSAIEKALAKVPVDRFETASELVSALEAPHDTKISRRTWLGSRLQQAALAVAVGVAVFVTWRIVSPPDLPDPKKVIVFPLVERGLEASAAGVGWSVAIAIGTALEHSQPLKVYDGWTWLSESNRMNPVQVTQDVARHVSLDRGARYYIDGVVGHDSDSASVVLWLHDAAGDSLVTQASAKDAISKATFPGLALRAVTTLLPKLLEPDREVDLTPLTDRDPGAVAIWLLAEREYRRSQFLPALELYERAVQEDSLLALAALKGAQAANWKGRWDQMSQLIALAVAHDSLLPSKYAHLARGYDAYLRGHADSALALFLRAVAEDPEWPEPAIMVAETFYHLFPSESPLDSLAEVWFLQALETDSTFTMPLVHLTEIALRRGDINRAERLIRQFESVDPDTVWLRRLYLMLHCVRDGPQSVNWGDEVYSDADAVLFTSADLAVAASQTRCAERGFRALLASDSAPRSHKWNALQGLQGLLLAHGRVDETLALLDSALEAGERSVYRLFIFDALVGFPVESRAATAERLARRHGELYERADPEARWLLGAWHAYFGSLDKARRIATSLSAAATETGDATYRLVASAVEAHVAIASGDTTRAVALLKQLSPTTTRVSLSWSLVKPLPLERLQLARIQSAQAVFEDAYKVATIFDHQQPIMFLPCLKPSLEIRLQAAEDLSWRRTAGRIRKRLESLGGANPETRGH